MVDHLSLMGIQRWHQRKSLDAVDPIGDHPKVEADSHSLDNKVREVDSTTASEGVSAYAAISVRRNAYGEQRRWLWMTPQPTLSANERQLIDRMVVATESQWESVGIADNYFDRDELERFLQEDIAALVVLSNDVSWEAITSHKLFLEERYIMGFSLSDLQSGNENKKEIWRQLQRLMEV